MTPAWAYLDEHDRDTFRATIAFLQGRLAQSSTVDWALSLNVQNHIPRLALQELLTSSNSLSEPWNTAWRIIEEAWSEPPDSSPSSVYSIQERLSAGERSGSVILAIVKLVAPRLRVEKFDEWRLQFTNRPSTPRTFDDLLSARVSSGETVDLNVLRLSNVDDTAFLISLASALERALDHGLDIGRRLGWNKEPYLGRLGNLARIEYVNSIAIDDDDQDPDAYNQGIAPVVKLLFAIVSRIAAIAPQAAVLFIQRWMLGNSPIHTRLWAAAAKNSSLVSTEQASKFTLERNPDEFWEVDSFPEITELRASRFSEFEVSSQDAIIAQIRKGPPRSHWPRRLDSTKFKIARSYCIARELRRLEVSGNELPRKDVRWLSATIGRFPELENMRPDQDFAEGMKVRSIEFTPDDRYNSIHGEARLRTLEEALSTERGGWDDDDAERAIQWLSQGDHARQLINDLAVLKDGGNEFPRVWNRIGWRHSPNNDSTDEDEQKKYFQEADLVFRLIEKLSDETLRIAVEGLSNWLDSWGKYLVGSASGTGAWLRIWPIAIDATNARPEPEDEIDLSVTEEDARDGSTNKSKEIDTLNPPVGRLIGALLRARPPLTNVENPFPDGSQLKRMRDAVTLASGRSELITRHRLIENLPYFLNADESWTKQHLITPLLEDNSNAIALWRAVGRRTQFREVLDIIGNAMATRASDRRLSRETRRGLVFSLVVESLHAFREERSPAVSNVRLQQTLRTLEDEVRANAANAVQKFVAQPLVRRSTDLSGTANDEFHKELFHSAGRPFLEEVWPQERSLATPGVSRAFAELPNSSGEAFAEAVSVVERFLVPFDCWSLHDYGLRGDEAGNKKLAKIDRPEKSEALLRLLDLTIGTSEGAVVPHDLTDALDQIRSVAPHLAQSGPYRRLAAAARR